jgi:acetyl-CoA carboxylase biotin carboxyl carrier protein
MAKKKTGNGGGGAGRGAGSFTDTERVKGLIDLMTGNGLTEIELVEGESRIVLRRGTTTGGMAVSHGGGGGAGPHGHAASPGIAIPGLDKGGGGAGEAEEALLMIKSPMVGTFYAAPNPDSDAYVSVGTDVEKDKTIVCVIEAMKVFNEIHADVTGSITKVLVSNGQAVEFGQALFLVRPG